LYPITTGLSGDVFYLDVTSERCPLRGGAWNASANAGVFALYCGTARSTPGDSRGGRLALIL
jgi:hypothetical protein